MTAVAGTIAKHSLWRTFVDSRQEYKNQTLFMTKIVIIDTFLWLKWLKSHTYIAQRVFSPRKFQSVTGLPLMHQMCQNRVVSGNVKVKPPAQEHKCNIGWKFLKKLWCCVGGGNKVIWLYQLSWKCKLATVMSIKLTFRALALCHSLWYNQIINVT